MLILFKSQRMKRGLLLKRRIPCLLILWFGCRGMIWVRLLNRCSIDSNEWILLCLTKLKGKHNTVWSALDQDSESSGLASARRVSQHRLLSCLKGDDVVVGKDNVIQMPDEEGGVEIGDAGIAESKGKGKSGMSSKGADLGLPRAMQMVLPLGPRKLGGVSCLSACLD
ncbi:hypothetical protein L2E82_34807 [Cichorium intybus]|uniref:Uncharacterized protein n=1 Tax=Cichorium intybus TaxID=13427 RepID=A0ACB9BMR5_CICIN|nr:hypothetical protein L2E82_34807 [Cichorium intybus]